MPLLLAALVAGAATACGESTADRPAARLGDRQLTADRLAEILVLAQPLPIDEATAADLAQHWLEVSLVASRAAAGDSLLDPAVVAAAVAPDYRELRIAGLLEPTRREARAWARSAVDSVYAAGDVRLIAHVFRRVDANARPGEREFQRITIDQIRQRLQAGGAWAEAVRQSEDADTRGRDGLIGLVRRGELPPEFESAAFALRPGELSDVVETSFGFHVIRRPALAEARSTFERLLAEQMTAGAEAEIGRRLQSSARMVVLPDAAARTRAMAMLPWRALGRQDVLIRYEGGRLVEDDAARALLLLPSGSRQGLRQASDVEVETLLRELVLRTLLDARADSVGITPDSAGVAAVHERYRQTMETVWQAADIAPASLAAAGTDPASLAADRVDRYMEAIAARTVEAAPVPPLLAATLLEDADWDLNEAAIGAAVESARRMLAAADAR